MPGRYMVLSEALAYVAPRVGDAGQAKAQILALLARGELHGRAEHLEHFIAWENTRIPGKWRAERTRQASMIPVGADWWSHPAVVADWEKSTAHMCWDAEDQKRVGHLKDFKVYVSVLLVEAEIRKHWASKINARFLRVVKRKAAAAKHVPQRRGPKRSKLNAVVDAMKAAGGYSAVKDLGEEAMAAQFSASRETCRKARDLLSEFQETELPTITDNYRQATISDKPKSRF